MDRITPEQAREVLDRLAESDSDVVEAILLQYKSIAEGWEADYFFQRIFHKRFFYADGLPEEDVRDLIGADFVERGIWDGSLTLYKCQGNYIVGLSLTLSVIVDQGLIEDPSVLEKIAAFRTHTYDFSRFTTQYEIDLMNSAMDAVLEELGNKR